MKTKSIKSKETIIQLWYYCGKQKIAVILSVLASFLCSGSVVFGAFRLKFIINYFIVTANWQGLFNQLVLLGVIYGIGVIASLVQTQLMLRVAYKTLKEIRRDLFSKIQKLPICYTDSRSHGDIMSLFTNDIDAIQVTLEQSAIMVINNFLQLLGTFIVMFILSPKLVIITFIMSFLMLFITQKITKSSRRYFLSQQSDLASLSGLIEERINGINTIQFFSQEGKTSDQFQTLNQKYQHSSTKALTRSGMVLPIINQLNSINLALTAVAGSLLVLNGSMNIGGLSAYIQMTITYNQPFKMISMQINNVLAGLAAAARIFEVMDECDEENEGKLRVIEEKIHNQKTIFWNEPNKKAVTGKIEFKEVSFSYKMSNKILKSINLSIDPGEKVAFVGSTGAGKTTIINLINRFYNIQEGRILIDNKNIKDIALSDLRKIVGVVLQDTHLFTGTIAENIRYGKIDASEEEVIAAAKLSQADYFINQLPDGYETLLINDGENISSGQRQLIAIARTAIANPTILVLDEATSSVDTRTEAFVNQGISALMENRTVLIIAHRLSTVRDADKIIVLDRGEITEQGTHQTLLDKKGYYYKLNTGLVILE